MNFMQGFYRHNKTGNIYYAEKTLKNCTNTMEDEILVEYYLYKNQFVHFSEAYCREVNQFLEKFTKITIE